MTLDLHFERERTLETVAAIDLGSNSFHMLVGRFDAQGHFVVIDKVREHVRLGAGLNADRQLTAEAMERALSCLERFGERVRAMPQDRIRAVGTNTLRQAKNSRDFLARAERALGHAIEVIAGREEARLIYLGVAQTVAGQNTERRFVVDIGGGSTECIVGEGFEILAAHSLYMGCISYSLQFFADGVLSKERFEAAELAAELELQTLQRSFLRLGFQQAVGCSGTILAVQRILKENGWANGNISAKGLKKLRRELIDVGRMHQVQLAGLSEERRQVLPGGLAILCAVFEALNLEQLELSNGALREGLVYDLFGRIQHEDVRDRTIRRLCEQYKVDLEQSGRIEQTAHQLVDAVASAWRLDAERAKQLLSWAARLFTVGMSVSFTGYQKHSAYLVEHADMAGFSREDQSAIAAIVLSHRRKVRSEYFAALPINTVETIKRVSVLFRLAVTLHRSQDALPDIQYDVDATRLTLRFPQDWLPNHPLTSSDLLAQVSFVKNSGAISVQLELKDGEKLLNSATAK